LIALPGGEGREQHHHRQRKPADAARHQEQHAADDQMGDEVAQPGLAPGRYTQHPCAEGLRKQVPHGDQPQGHGPGLRTRPLADGRARFDTRRLGGEMVCGSGHGSTPAHIQEAG